MLLVTAAGWPVAGQAGPAQQRAGLAASARAAGGELARAGLLAHASSELMPVPGGEPGGAARVAPLRRLWQADLMVVSPATLPAETLTAVKQVAGVRAAVPVDAARIRMNGKFVAVLGVDPSAFRAFADKPTASDTALWQGVAAGNVAVSYTMGRLDRLPIGSRVTVAGHQQERLLVGALGTVGIPGVDAVVSGAVARSLGFPAGNAIVISARASGVKTRSALKALTARVRSVVPRTAVVETLVQPGAPATAGAVLASSSAGGAANGLMTTAQTAAMLRAALSRLGMPYVWGANGPRAFDCSGLVQWSFGRAGIVMPRVAADQARTGPAVPLSRLQAGDLLFYHTDPTAPGYISHVAIYLGRGLMIQAPEPGLDVEIVPVDLGSDFAGAIAVSPSVAAAAAAAPVG